MWNPIDDVGDWISDAVDAVKQVIKSGGVKNATRDVANRAATQGAGGGYAAPARARASEAALQAYNKQSKTYKDLALLADVLLTGGIADPIARAGSAYVTGDDAATQQALIDFGINTGLALTGDAAGLGLEAAVKELARRKALKEAGMVMGVHHSVFPGANRINVSTVPTGQLGITAGDQVPGYSYLWLNEFPKTGIEPTTKRPWAEVLESWYGDRNQMDQVTKMLNYGAQPVVGPNGEVPRVAPALANIIAEIPFQYRTMIDRWMELPAGKESAVTYITKVPGKKVEIDPNLSRDIVARLKNFPGMEGIETTGSRIKGPQTVLAEVPTGIINNIQYPYGVDVQALLDEYIAQYIKQAELPGNILMRGAQNAENIRNTAQAVSPYAARLAALAKLQQMNER
jgi:hypothetical protein